MASDLISHPQGEASTEIPGPWGLKSFRAGEKEYIHLLGGDAPQTLQGQKLLCLGPARPHLMY